MKYFTFALAILFLPVNVPAHTIDQPGSHIHRVSAHFDQIDDCLADPDCVAYGQGTADYNYANSDTSHGGGGTVIVAQEPTDPIEPRSNTPHWALDEEEEDEYHTHDGLRPHKHTHWHTHDLVDTYDNFCDFSDPNLLHRKFDSLCADRVGDEYIPQTIDTPKISTGNEPQEDTNKENMPEDTIVNFPDKTDRVPANILDNENDYFYVQQIDTDTGVTETVVIHRDEVDTTVQKVIAVAPTPKLPPELMITHIDVNIKPYAVIVYVKNDMGRFINVFKWQIRILDSIGNIKQSIMVRKGSSFTYQNVNCRKNKDYLNDEGICSNNRFVIATQSAIKRWNYQELPYIRFFTKAHGKFYKQENRYNPDIDTIEIVWNDEIMTVVATTMKFEVMGAPPMPKSKLSTSWANIKRRR